MLMALVVLAGWHAHIRAVVQIFHGSVPIQYNTALCFLALGAAGIGLSPRRRLLLLGGGSFAALMGAVVIVEYAAGISFGIDTLFFYPWERSLSTDAGRMALTTAISFFLTGGALVVLAARNGAYGIFGIVNSVPLSLALTSLIGSSFRITYILPFDLGSQMALHTSVGFLAYGIAMLGYAWKYAERGPDGLPKWGASIGVAFLPVLLVGSSALFPRQSWRVVPLEALISILVVALITLAVLRLTTAKVAYKGLLMIAAPLILLLIFVGGAAQVKHQSEAAEVSALHRKEVIGVSLSLLARIAEAESAVRGYVITGDGTFVNSYASWLESVTGTTTQLQNLVSDNPLQEASAGKIEQLTVERMYHLSDTVEFVKTGNKKQAEEKIKEGSGTALMAQIRADVGEFTQEEDRLDAEGRQILEASWQRLSWLLVAGLAAAILLAAILTLLFSGGISRRLQRLRDNAISLAAGKELAPPLAGHDEIADLDRVFHEMAESLDEVTRREKAVIEGTTDGIFVNDLDQRFLMMNQGGADLLGKTVAEVIGASVHDLFAPETAWRILELDNEILAGGKTTTCELLATTKAGVERTYLATRGPYRDRHGNVVGIIGINRDITEQKRAEQALATSEKRYRALVDDGQGLICTHDLDGKLLTVNPAAAESLGYTPGEMVGRNLIEYVTPALQQVFPHYLKRIRSESHVNGFLNLLNKQGEERIWMYRNSRIAEPGAMTYVLGYAQDVTDSKRAEDQLRALTQRLSLATQVGNVGVWDWDVQTNSVNWDERMYDIYGIARGTAIDYDRWRATVVAEDLPAYEAALQQAIAGKSPEVSEFRILRADGSLHHVQAAQGVMLDRAGTVRHVIGLNVDITVRKLAEEALRASETRFQRAFDHAPTGLALVSPAGRFLQVNESFCGMVGHSKEELLALDFQSITLRDDLAASNEIMRQLMGGEFTTVQLEKRYLHKLGHEVFALTHLSLVQDAQAKPLYVIAQVQDITERRRAERERQVIAEIVQGVITTASLDELLNLVHVSIGKLLSAENCFVALYDKTSDLLHIPFCKDEFDPIAAPQKLGRGLTAFVLRSGSPMLLTSELIQELVSRGDIELVGTLSAAWLGVPLRTSSEIVGVLVVQHYKDKDAYTQQDVELLASVGDQIGLAVERKRTEEALMHSEQRFRDLFENASDVIYTADFNGNFTSLNRSGERMTGYTREEALHLNFSQVVSPETLKLVQEMTARKLERHDETVYELEFFKKGGEPLLVEVSSRAMYKNGKPVGIQGIGRDITQRKQIEAELKLARDAALESVRLKSEFLANMSHEIRTPMNGIIGMTGLLLDTALTAEQRDFTETISASAEALLKIIDDILDFSKIEAGLLHFEKIDFDLRGAVEATVGVLAERAEAKGLELASLVHRGVPTALQGDPGRVRQVLTNLAGNAVKSTERGEVVVSVKKVNETALRAMLRFEVRDSGIGISAEAQQGLFRAFTQADGSTTRKYGGTGLGLAISKQLVELMGGEIGIESTPGHGSTFWFTAEFEKQSEPATTDSETAGSLSAARVLIVDDNATNRNILNHQTSSWGMIATEAESGERALELLRAGARQGQPYDIAILDLMMPEMSGFQLAEAIKADPSIAAVALVLLPSFGKRGHGEKAQQIGIAACLQKPVRQSELYDCLTTVMARSAGIEPVTPTSLVSRHSVREAEVQQEDKTFSNVRIIIAEDNMVNQRVALAQLRRLGYRAEAVPNGRELLKALENAEVDLILMDCQMPEMDGFAATAEIRRREGATRHTIIIAMTADAFDGDDERCLAAGMDDYLSKPVKAEVMRQKLERWAGPPETAGFSDAVVPAGNTEGNV
jgi:two-component system, sensor histidine kinase and response regulator